MHSSDKGSTWLTPRGGPAWLKDAVEKARQRREWEKHHPEEAQARKAQGLSEARAAHEKRQLEAMDEHLERCGVGERERDLLLEGALSESWGQVTPPGGRPYSALTEARAWWDAPGEVLLALIGQRGTGKSAACADLFTRCRFGYTDPELGAVWCWPAVVSQQPLYRTASRLATLPLFGDEAAREKEHLRTCRLLVVDELGQEHMTDPWLALVQDLVNERYRYKRKTVLAGNLTKQEFARRYGARITRRVEDAGRIVDMGETRLTGRREVRP